MRTIQFGGDLHAHFGALHGGLGNAGVGHGCNEVAAKPHPHLQLSVAHRTHSVDGINAVLARRVETELGLQGIEESRRHLFPDAHGAVTLHVAVAANR